MRHTGLTRRIGKMRHRDAAERANRAGDNHLAALGHIALLIPRAQQRQERCEAEVHAADVNAKGLVERRGVGVPKVLLYIGEGPGRRNFNRGGTWNTRVCNEKVNIASFFSNMRDDAL